MSAAAAQRVQQMEAEAKAWIELVLEKSIGDGRLQPLLQDGVVLCNVARRLEPDICPQPSGSAKPFSKRENIGNYLTAVAALGVPGHDMFSTVDLYEARTGQQWQSVLINLHSLGRVMQRRPGYSGPALGAKLAKKNARSFTAAQMLKAKNAMTFVGAGSFRSPLDGAPRLAVHDASAQQEERASSKVGTNRIDPTLAVAYEQATPTLRSMTAAAISHPGTARVAEVSVRTTGAGPKLDIACDAAGTAAAKQAAHEGANAQATADAKDAAEDAKAKAAADAKAAAEEAQAAAEQAEASHRAAEERERTARAVAVVRAGEAATIAAVEAHGVHQKWISHAAALQAAEAIAATKSDEVSSSCMAVGSSASVGRQTRPSVFNSRRHAELEALLVEVRGPQPRRQLSFGAWPASTAIRQLHATDSSESPHVAAANAHAHMASAVKRKARAPSTAHLELLVSYHGLSLPRVPPNTQQFDQFLRGVTGKQPVCQPIALLFGDTLSSLAQSRGKGPALRLLATSEWHDEGESRHGTFARLLGFDAASLVLGPNAKLRLQLRNVVDPFFDASDDGTTLEARLLAMPLIGEATLSVAASIEAALRGEVLVLTMMRPVLEPSADPIDAIGGTALVRIRHALGLHLAKTHPSHSVSNYLWRLHEPSDVILRPAAAKQSTSDVPEQTPQAKRRAASVDLPHLDGLRAVQQQHLSNESRAGSELRVSEHLLPCAYGLHVPLATLAMLLEDAELCAEAGLSDSRPAAAPMRVAVGAATPVKAATRGASGMAGALDDAEEALLGALDAPDWSALALWIRRMHVALVGCVNETLSTSAAPEPGQLWLTERLPTPLAPAALGGVQSVAAAVAPNLRMGFKSSAQQALSALAPMPTNLCISVLEVLDKCGSCIYPTVTLGALAAHSLGFAAGGAESFGAAEVGTPRLSAGSIAATSMERARHYAKRCVLLKCQTYAALATSFALSCQTAVARHDRAFFKACVGLGYLVQLESLLTTRGDEWAMLQDVSVAVMMMRRVVLTIVPNGSAAVSVRGARHCPVLTFTLSELGFRDSLHATALGLPCGSLVNVHSTLATQGINDEQTLANLLRTNTVGQAQLNARCVEQLAAYHERRVELFTSKPVSAGDGAAALLSPRQRAEKSASVLKNIEATERNAADGPLRQSARIGVLLSHARSLLRTPPEDKNVELLTTISSLTRLLGGGRFTMCPSGCDRTAMSVTLEHGQLLQEHGLDEAAASVSVATMRRSGVRRENAARNGGTRTYGFNVLQTSMLPKAYRPPSGSSMGVGHG